MRKSLVIATVAAGLGMLGFSAQAKADPVGGMIVGGAIGAAAGGPVGAAVGAVIGSIIGSDHHYRHHRGYRDRHYGYRDHDYQREHPRYERRPGGAFSFHFTASFTSFAASFTSALKSPITPLAGQTENTGHFLQPTAMATGQIFIS